MKATIWGPLLGLLLFTAIPTWAETQGSLSLSEAGFVSPDYNLTEKKDFQFFSGGLDTLTDLSKETEITDTLHTQVRGMVSPGTSVLNYLDVSQLFWKQQSLIVGRKKMNWNDLDERFHLGIYQPLFLWNPLTPEEQGLTGIFLNLHSDESSVTWGVTLFGSPLFIPNQNAGYELKNGKFQNTNPYFSPTMTSVIINGQKTLIQYDLQRPQTQDVVFQQSYAGKIFLGEEKQGVYSQISYANKPVNDLSLGVQGYANSDNSVSLLIQPKVQRQSLIGADLHYTGSFVQTGLSAIREAPQAPDFKTEWTYSRYSDSVLLSPFVTVRALNSELLLSVLSVQGGESQTVGPEADQVARYLPSRYPFRNAGLVQLRTSYRMKKSQKLLLSTRYLRGEKGEFDLWTSEATYQWNSRWTAQLAGQFLAIERQAERTSLDPYVNNDLVSVGVSYVF